MTRIICNVDACACKCRAVANEATMKRIVNAPAQPRIAYRIGRYSDFLDDMLRAIDAAPELAAWTHRHADDPGIALVESAAILCDVLSFYQEHYANEAYLRTAAWRESVAELVRLTGYRLAPGLGGRATFAFEVRGSEAVTIREGFAIKAELQDGGAPTEFQTVAQLLAWPHLARMHLYSPRVYDDALAAGTSHVELASIDGASDSASLAAAEFKPGDRLMLIPDEAMWSTGGGAYRSQAKTQIITIAKVARTLDRVVLELEKPLVERWSAPVRAWRVGRTFRHFGHNAPPQLVKTLVAADGEITGASAEDTRFERSVTTGAAVGAAANVAVFSTSTSANSSQAARRSRSFQREISSDAIASGQVSAHAVLDSNSSSIQWYSSLEALEMPLDQEASDFAAGGVVLLQGRVRFTGQTTPVPFVVTRSSVEARAAAVQWGNQSGPSTILTLDSALVQNTAIANAVFDIRDVRVHEVTSPPLTLRPIPTPASGELTTGAGALAFYGTASQAQALAGRRLYMAHDDGRSIELVCTNAVSDFATPTPNVAQCWILSFDRPPTPFRLEDFSEEEPTVVVFGNLIDASQGRSEREAILGNGDQRRAFQTFALPKAPLTYLLAPGSASAHSPELQIWVGDRLWTRVDAFYGHGPEETIYIVREDSEGRSFVQFGDGETGSRLPSGTKNVRAVYRTGTGARGALKAGAAPTASERPPGFNKVSLAGIVSGGADPEDLECAREAAPGGVQSLGRLVSVTDYQTEALAIPGVVTAVASWDLHVGLPVVLLRVLLEAGREAEFSAVQSALSAAQRCAGPDRFPLVVEQASMRYAFLDLSYARDVSYAAEFVDAAIRAALGLADDAQHARDGVFGLRARRLGEPEYASRIEGRVQNVPGVQWCRVVALGVFDASVIDPNGAILPNAPHPLSAVLGCAPNELLQLAEPHLTLTESAATLAGECAA
jgi:hypothetical protein